MVPEEFKNGGGDRGYFEGYQLKNQGDFMQSVKRDKEQMKAAEMDELLSVASMAGIRVKDPSTRLSKFELEEDDDDLDLSVPDDS